MNAKVAAALAGGALVIGGVVTLVTPSSQAAEPIRIPWSQAQIVLSEINPNYSLDKGLGYMNVTITNNNDYTVEIVRTYWDWGDQQPPEAFVAWMGLCYDGTENYCDFDEYYWQSQPGSYIWLPSPCPPTTPVGAPRTPTATYTPSNTPIPPTPTPTPTLRQ